MKSKVIFILFLSLFILSACTSCPEKEGRTYYDTLDLDTPEEAVATFSDAFALDDYLTVYLVFSTKTQYIFIQNLRLLNYSHLFDRNYQDVIFESVTTFAEGFGQGEHIDDGWYIYDQIMLAAKENNALLIDLSGEVTILDTKPSESDWVDEDTTDVITHVEGIEEEVIFRMLQAPSGKWRVLQVIVPGGDEEMVPWAVPPQDE